MTARNGEIDTLLADCLAADAAKTYNSLVKEVMKKHIKTIEKNNDPHSHFELGCAFHQGKGAFKKDLEKAFAFYQNASNLGHPVAPYYLYQLYGGQQDKDNEDKIKFIDDKHDLIDMKLKLLIKAAACGAYCKAEQMFSYHFASSIDWQRAVDRYRSWLEEQIKLEDDQRKLGQLYNHLGYLAYKKGTISGRSDSRQCYKNSYAYFRKAAQLGCAAAYYFLGYWLYRLKFGYDGNDYKRKAQRYLQKAADHGHVLSKLLIIKDYHQAYSTEYVIKCLLGSSTYAFSVIMYYMGNLYSRGYGKIVSNQKLALDYFKLAVINNTIETFPFPDTCKYYSLAFMYHYKLGIDHNFIKASHYYYLALANKNNNLYSYLAGWQIGKLIERKRVAFGNLNTAIQCFKRTPLNPVDGYGAYRLGKLLLKQANSELTTREGLPLSCFKNAMNCPRLSPYHKGIMYEYGLGVDVDLKEARTLYLNIVGKDWLLCDINTAYLADKARQRISLIEAGTEKT